MTNEIYMFEKKGLKGLLTFWNYSYATNRGGDILTFLEENKPTFYISPGGFECGLVYTIIIQNNIYKIFI